VGVKKSTKLFPTPQSQQIADLLQGSSLLGGRLETPAKMKPGKRTVSEDLLIRDRDSWAHLLESYWGKIGWELKRARTVEDIYRAFQALDSERNDYLLSPFLRSTTEISDKKALYLGKRAFDASLTSLMDADKRRNAQAESVRQSEAAVFELSKKNREQLQNEVVRRKKNLREMTIRLSQWKGGIRKTDLALANAKPDQHEPLMRLLKSQIVEVARIETEHKEEERILERVKERLSAITPEREKAATEIHNKRKAALQQVEQDVLKARIESEELEKQWLDRQAHVCRAELLRFIQDKKKRYAYTPRNLANALAGLPDMGCRRSATLMLNTDIILYSVK
jgi:hypothetical protein